MSWKSALAPTVLALAAFVAAIPAGAYPKAEERDGYRRVVVPSYEHRRVEGVRRIYVPEREAVAVESPIRRVVVRRTPRAEQKIPARDR